jgi:hypothetical protein
VARFHPREDSSFAVGLRLQVWWSRPSWVGLERRPCPCPYMVGPRVSEPLYRVYRAELAAPLSWALGPGHELRAEPAR